MASSGGALNLSLLSRGIGEISKNGHEKIDVVFEPQDYFNFSGNTSRIYLPPITPKYDFDAATGTPGKFKIIHEMPKTFTTRKGALLLYSEDQAHRSSEQNTFRKGHRKHQTTEEMLELTKSEDDLSLKTVDDLAKSILSFGKRDTTEEPEVYLGFVHNYGRRKKDLFERQIRPGFSAKRYLSLWTKSWDDNVLGKVISKGYLTEKSLFYYNPLNPHLQRRLNDDMSHYPAPYKLMRSMLMSPGSLSGYTFYRVRPESADTVVTPEYIERGQTPSQKGSIKVISTKDGVQKEVSYSALDKDAKEEVLTDLLVKSAVHYAMKKQQEYIDESHREKPIPEGDESRRSSVQQFDMKDAVESLLDSQRGKGAINTDFPEDKSEVSSRSGSIKGKTLKRSKASKDKATSPIPGELSDGEREYVGNVPVASVRGEQSSIPQLPHISGPIPLTPIGEASREGTRMTIPISLPPIGQEMGIDESDESGVGLKTERTEQTDKSDRRYVSEDTERRKRKKRLAVESSGLALSGGYHLQSSTESLTQTSSHSLPAAKPLRTHWKGSTQSLKSDRSKKGSGSQEDGSNKGSIVIGPDGEPISVGGHIEAHTRPDHQHIENVGDANRYFGRDLVSDQESDDEPDVWKRKRGIQREDMRNYAHKRERGPGQQRQQQRRSVVPRQTSFKSKSNTLSAVNRSVRFSASSKDKDEGFEEIDYTAGDIDATLSINSWSYMPRDSDPEFAGIVNQVHASSLPGMPFRSGSGQSIQSQISEKDIIDVLENTARHIANSTLSRSDSGQDIEKDARQAAELWLEKNAPRIISRSQSVQDVEGGDNAAIKTAVENGRKSAGPSAGEYKDLIKEKLQTALSNTDGESIPIIPDDAELSPELLEALKNNSITPDDIEVVRDEETGKNIVRSKSQLSTAMGGVKEGHIYVPVAKKEDEDRKSERSGRSQRSRSDEEIEEPEDEFKKAVEEVEKVNEAEEGVKSELGRQSVVSKKSEKSAVSDDKKSKVSEKSDVDKKKNGKPADKKDEFVVGKVKEKNEMEALYGPPSPPPKGATPPGEGKPKDTKPKKPGKKTTEKPPTKGKGKAKKEKEPEPKPAEPEPEPEPQPPKEPTPPPLLPVLEDKGASDNESDQESLATTHKSSESDFEFHFVRETPSPTPPPPPKPPSTIPSVDDEPTDEDEKPEDEDDEAARLRMISNREARAAKRAAQAAKRKEEVERKRREKEEHSRREREEQERAENLKREMEAERRKTLEAKRQKKMEEDMERDREAQEQEDRMARQRAEAEREKRRKEEYQRKLDEMKRKQAEDEQRRYEEQMQRLREEEERRKEEEEKMALMAEEERIEYERKKKIEEEERKIKEAEEKRKREEEAQRAMEEARRLAEEMARKQAEMEARLRFNRSLQVEARGLDHSHNITEAFVFSYFELLNWFGLDVPEFELLKLNQY